MIARLAREEDIPAIMKLGRAFFDLAGWPAVATWDDASVETMLKGFITGHVQGALIVAEHEGHVVGMCSMILAPFYFNLREVMGQELFWYVDPTHRSTGAGRAMLDMLEGEAVARGAAVFIMSSVSGLRDEALARVYERRGYRPADRQYIKRL